MITQEVQFTKTDKQGKETPVKVMLGYCFATEIMFHELAGQNVSDFVKEALEALQNNKFMEDPRTVHLIRASIESYYESVNKKAPITDKDIVASHHKDEIGTMFGTVLSMYLKMNMSPQGDGEDKKENQEEEVDDDSKNA